MERAIMVLGGYGGVGKSMSRNLLKYTDCTLKIAGRNIKKAEFFVAILKQQFPSRDVQTCYADASEIATLITAFQSVDLVIITATIPDFMDDVAKVALQTHTDIVDILVRGDVVDKLSKCYKAIVSDGRRFITQAGFHPGLATPLIRLAKPYFDDYQIANVVIAMDAIFENPTAIHEIMHELVHQNAQILEDGKWRKATYRDALTVQFSKDCGAKKCFPLQMREMYGLERELGLRKAGVYASGFSPFIDNIVFPLAMLIGFVSKKASRRIASKLLHMSAKDHRKNRPKVEFRLDAEGTKNGKKRTVTLTVVSDNAFNLTSLVVLAGLNQYFNGVLAEPGLYLMGQVVDETKLFADLRRMGIQVDEATSQAGAGLVKQ
ncbi:MAG: saccharopine dehydrogenase NADP-binding domain-containing protein [Bacteroidota bacterium]